MLLTVRDASRLLRTPERQVYRWVDDGQIPFQRVNDQIRFSRAELLEWATNRHMPVAIEIFHAADEPGEHAPSLAAALRLGGVHHDVTGIDRDSAIRSVVERMRLPVAVDRELLTEVLLARESTGSTAIGSGIAIPHVRNPVVLGGAPASVSLCRLEQPVPFGAPDGQPVKTLFMIVSPTVRAHLQILARLSWALHDPAFKAAVERGGTLEEIVREAERLEASET